MLVIDISDTQNNHNYLIKKHGIIYTLHYDRNDGSVGININKTTDSLSVLFVNIVTSSKYVLVINHLYITVVAIYWKHLCLFYLFLERWINTLKSKSPRKQNQNNK